mmetsp:Transcript_29928/g.78475  ORF Transcript_29928/g.78475 Transcript_29928/m.78475 type:complete len:152 (-) Transcript_29928:696-1151(-)
MTKGEGGGGREKVDGWREVHYAFMCALEVHAPLSFRAVRSRMKKPRFDPHRPGARVGDDGSCKRREDVKAAAAVRHCRGRDVDRTRDVLADDLVPRISWRGRGARVADGIVGRRVVVCWRAQSTPFAGEELEKHPAIKGVLGVDDDVGVDG